jgi:ankyrin repeat protein
MKAALNGNVSALIAAADVANLHDFRTLSATHFLPLHSAICGASIHHSEHLVAQTVHALMRFHVDVNAQDLAGDTPLHKVMQVWMFSFFVSEQVSFVLVQVAPWESIVPLMKCLLQYDADVNIQNTSGSSLVHLAMHRMRPQTLQILELLHVHSAALNTPAADGTTPFLLAVQHASSLSNEHSHVWILVVRYMLQQGVAWIPFRDENGNTLLHLLLDSPCPPEYAKQHVELVSSLLGSKCVDINAVDNSGDSAIHLFCRCGRVWIARFAHFSNQCVCVCMRVLPCVQAIRFEPRWRGHAAAGVTNEARGGHP